MVIGSTPTFGAALLNHETAPWRFAKAVRSESVQEKINAIDEGGKDVAFVMVDGKPGYYDVLLVPKTLDKSIDELERLYAENYSQDIEGASVTGSISFITGTFIPFLFDTGVNGIIPKIKRALKTAGKEASEY